MFELVQQLATTNPFTLAFSALIFDIPRYTLSLGALGLFGAGKILRAESRTSASRPSA